MFPSDRIWLKLPGASIAALEKLRASAGVDLPNEYLELLAYSNGGEGPLQVPPYTFCLDSAEEATMYKEERTYEEFFPSFFVFGGAGGGEYIALDLRGSEPWPVVAIDMTNIDLSESVQFIARDFTSFLTFVGIESADA